MKELYRFRQFLNEDKKGSFRNKFSKGSSSEEYNDFETYYERWEDEWAKPGNAMVFDFDDEDEWGDYKGGKVASHTWEIGYEEEDDHYAPIINNMLNYLEKNKTYSYKNDDGINVKFEIYNPGTIDMEVYYSADDIEKYKNKFNDDERPDFSYDNLLKENMSLEVDEDFIGLSADSGEYDGDLNDDGTVDFSVVGYEEEREDGQIDFEDYNWKSILGPKHAFVQISDQIPTKVEAAGDYVMITVDLEDLKKLIK